MHIGYRGELLAERRLRAGFIGCGSHAFRNIYPALQFAPVELVCTCDRDADKAAAFARQFGAERSYHDHRQMLEQEDLEAVFIVTGYDERGRPQYPQLTIDCLNARAAVWIEKPPAATPEEIEAMQQAAARADRPVVVGLKKMFAPANRKAASLMGDPAFGQAHLMTLQYPQSVPDPATLRAYMAGENAGAAIQFLDHLCHPLSVLLSLFGMPRQLSYQTSRPGGGVATFSYDDGRLASLALTKGQSSNAPLERTVVVSDDGQHVVVENNTRVVWYRRRQAGRYTYGATPDFFAAPSEDAALLWEPEWSLGQLYNKALFLLGYVDEVQHFVRCALEGEAPVQGTLEQAMQVTRIFHAFAEGPGRAIDLSASA